MPPPHVLASLVPESAMFEDLLKMEQKLDWTILRKKAEVTDALGKPIRVRWFSVDSGEFMVADTFSVPSRSNERFASTFPTRLITRHGRMRRISQREENR